MRSFREGDIDIAVAIHGRGTGSPQWMFPDVPPDRLAQAIDPYLDDQGHIEFVFSSVIVRLGDHVVLLDAGPAPVHGSRASSIVRALTEANLSPRDVDTVVISHGHDDHIGGLTDNSTRTAITFADARHYIAAAEFGHWTSGPERDQLAAQNLTRIEATGALTLVDDEQEIIPGLTLLPAPGHTPGHLAVVIGSCQDRALYVGDALAHQVNVPHPDWNHFSDMLPDQARRSRQDLVERATEDNYLILASHIPIAGQIRTANDKRKLEPVEPVRR